MTRQDISRLIRDDPFMMDIIRTAATLQLPDWWICAGFIRSKVWDTLLGVGSRTEIPDVDVIYFDPDSLDESDEKRHDAVLRNLLPNIPWSVKNEARMHWVNDIPPYTSAVDAISKFPETVTSLGVKLDASDELLFIAPHGIDDLLNFFVQPTPYFEESLERARIFETRFAVKRWYATWNRVTVRHPKVLLRP